MNAVEIRKVYKSFGSFRLEDISLALPEGSVMGLIGENGVGKSTLISLMTGALLCESGSISLLGTDTRSSEFVRAKQDIGTVFDFPCFPPELNAKGINDILRRIYVNWDEDSFFGYTERFGIDRKRKFKSYSKGMRVKLPIAAALSHKARLLIMDEPTSGLDPVARDELLDIIEDFTLDERCSAVISSHIPSDLERICDYIAYIHKGRLKFFAEKDELCDSMAVVSCDAEDLRELPSEAVIGARFSDYGAEALVKRDMLIDGMHSRRASIEDIMIYTSRGVRKENGR